MQTKSKTHLLCQASLEAHTLLRIINQVSSGSLATGAEWGKERKYPVVVVHRRAQKNSESGEEAVVKQAAEALRPR